MAAASFSAYANVDKADAIAAGGGEKLPRFKHTRTYEDGVKEVYTASFAAKHFDAYIQLTAKVDRYPHVQVLRLCPVI
jgi:hypothetical protein